MALTLTNATPHTDAGRSNLFNLNRVGTVGSSVAGLSVLSEGGGVDGVLRQTVLKFDAVSVTMTDDTTDGSHGTVNIYDFPEGMIEIDHVQGALSFTAGSGGIADTGALVFSLGSAAISTDNATLLGTEADVLASQAATLVGGTKTNTFSTRSAITALTDSSGGTANDTIEAIGGSFSQSEIRNNFADLAAKVNALIAAQGGKKSTVLDGTSAAATLNLNLAVPDAGSSANDTLTVTGYIVIHWKNHGDVVAS